MRLTAGTLKGDVGHISWMQVKQKVGGILNIDKKYPLMYW
ncbi:MAG: hypothetical protein JWP37_1593 [Mucilaginibacter sp.]|nr:hypothetical protein [Mucilaginibacter sp.]